METDPQLSRQSCFRHLEYQDMGTVGDGGHQLHIKEYDNGPRFASPVLGQHNEQVLRDVLRMTDDEITEAIIAEAIV